MIFKILTYIFLLNSMIILVGCATSAADSIVINDENSIPDRLIEDLKLSDTSQLTLAECAQKFTTQAEPIVIRDGDQIPTNVILLINFDEVYMDATEFPVEEICAVVNNGIYLTRESFTAPNIARMWYIREST